jgi:hypothetical protein
MTSSLIGVTPPSFLGSWVFLRRLTSRPTGSGRTKDLSFVISSICTLFLFLSSLSGFIVCFVISFLDLFYLIKSSAQQGFPLLFSGKKTIKQWKPICFHIPLCSADMCGKYMF